MARLAAALLALALAAEAEAGIYRCRDGEGGLRFSDDPHACADAVVHTPDAGRLPDAPPADAPPAATAPAASPPPIAPARLAGLLPPVPAGWEALNEAPELTADPGMRARGLRASVARHYTRARGPVSEVCTVELWSFVGAAQARAALASLGQPRWWGRPSGALLVLAHGVRLERQVGARHGLVEGCRALGESAAARARAAAE